MGTMVDLEETKQGVQLKAKDDRAIVKLIAHNNVVEFLADI